MDHTTDFVSYKKILVFGAESTGKTTLTNRLIKGEFSEKSPPKDSDKNKPKDSIYNYIFNHIFYK